MILTVNRDYFLNSIKQLIVMLKCGVLFEGLRQFEIIIILYLCKINFFRNN
jgi:hypothetical protein